MKGSSILLKNIISNLYKAIIHIKKINKTFKMVFKGNYGEGGSIDFFRHATHIMSITYQKIPKIG